MYGMLVDEAVLVEVVLCGLVFCTVILGGVVLYEEGAFDG